MTNRCETFFVEGAGRNAARTIPEIMKLARWMGVSPIPGELVAEDAAIIAPDGSVFIALTIRGDLDTWRRVVRAYVATRALELARIEFGDLICESGFSWPLRDCVIDRRLAA